MRLTLHQRQIIWAYLFMSVALVFFVVIRWYPTILAFNVSFRDWNVFEGSGPWVGIENYQEIWQDAGKPRSSVTAAFSNTVRYVLFGVPSQLVLALAIALLLAQIRRFAAVFRVAYFAPYVTSAVAVAFVWNWLYQPETGLINQALDLVGLPQQPFTKSPTQALPSITAVAVWQNLGFAIIIFLAGIQQIPGLYYEAARIDGANSWQLFWRITLPLLNPIIVYLTVLGTISYLRLFALVQNMSPQGTGGPLESTTTVVLEVYREGFSSYKMGYAGALTVLLFFLILLITIIQLRFLFATGGVLGRGAEETLVMATSTDIGNDGALQVAEHFMPARGKGGRRFGWAVLIAYFLLTIGGICMVTPFFWMILTSVKPPPELVNFSFFPANPTLQNYLNVLNTSSFERWYLNSIIVATISTTSVIFFDCLVGYTLNKFDFPGKNIIFIGMLGTLMIPTEMLIIPWFTMSVNWNWHIGYAQYWGIAFPGVITAAGIFLMRQFYDGVPNELLDAARMDGMNEFGIWWRIAVPLVKPAIAALAIFNFIGNWNAYLWPLILANSREFYTLPVGLSFFRGESTTHLEKIMTAASLASIPLLIVFLVFQRQIIRGIALTGLKG